MEEVKERLAAFEGRETVIAERHKHLRERREVFDDRRFAYRKRRDEIEERRARVAEQGAQIEETLRAKAALDREAAAALVLERVQSELVAERAALVEATVAEIIGDRVETSANDLIVQGRRAPGRVQCGQCAADVATLARGTRRPCPGAACSRR